LWALFYAVFVFLCCVCGFFVCFLFLCCFVLVFVGLFWVLLFLVFILRGWVLGVLGFLFLFFWFGGVDDFCTCSGGGLACYVWFFDVL